MVSQQSMTFMIISAVLSILVPVATFLYFKKKHKINWKPLLIGLLIFLVFSQVIGNSVNAVVLRLNGTSAEFFSSNPYFYAAYGSLSSGIFEEVGRFIGFAFLLKMYRDWKDGVSYGIGHGGLEAILIGGFAGIQNFMMANLINSGGMEQMSQMGGEQAAALIGVRDQLVGTSSEMFLLGGFERIMVFALQIALSLLVLYGVKNNKIQYLFYAILIHASINFVALLSQALGLHILITEGVLLIAAILSIVFILRSRTVIQSSGTLKKVG
jgi:uncharacterized membrane protein YhfC